MKTIKFYRDYFDAAGNVQHKVGDVYESNEADLYVHQSYANYYDKPKQAETPVKKTVKKVSK